MVVRRFAFALLVLSVLVFVLNFVSAIPITGCTIITQPGNYELMNDIHNHTGLPGNNACIMIRAHNVFFDGRGHIINTSSRTLSTDYVGGSSSVVENVSLANFIILKPSSANSREGLGVFGAINGYFANFSIIGGYMSVSSSSRSVSNSRFSNFSVVNSPNPNPSMIITSGNPFQNNVFSDFSLVNNVSGNLPWIDMSSTHGISNTTFTRFYLRHTRLSTSTYFVNNFIKIISSQGKNIIFSDGVISSSDSSYNFNPIQFTSPVFNGPPPSYGSPTNFTFENIRFELVNPTTVFNLTTQSYLGNSSQFIGMSFINSSYSYNGLSGTFRYGNRVYGISELLVPINSENPISGPNFDSFYQIGQNSITIVSSAPSIFNVHHRLTLYGLGNYQIPTIYRNGVECGNLQGCVLESFSGGKAVFVVPGFGTYSIGERAGGGNNESPWDYNHDGTVNVQDIFAFLSDWFAHS